MSKKPNQSTIGAMTVADVARELRVDPETVRQAIDQGQLRAIRMSKRIIRILRSEFDAWLARGGGAADGEAA